VALGIAAGLSFLDVRLGRKPTDAIADRLGSTGHNGADHAPVKGSNRPSPASFWPKT
jgi:hypothetical protein